MRERQVNEAMANDLARQRAELLAERIALGDDRKQLEAEVRDYIAFVFHLFVFATHKYFGRCHSSNTRLVRLSVGLDLPRHTSPLHIDSVKPIEYFA